MLLATKLTSSPEVRTDIAGVLLERYRYGGLRALEGVPLLMIRCLGDLFVRHALEELLQFMEDASIVEAINDEVDAVFSPDRAVRMLLLFEKIS